MIYFTRENLNRSRWDIQVLGSELGKKKKTVEVWLPQFLSLSGSLAWGCSASVLKQFKAFGSMKSAWVSIVALIQVSLFIHLRRGEQPLKVITTAQSTYMCSPANCNVLNRNYCFIIQREPCLITSQYIYSLKASIWSKATSLWTLAPFPYQVMAFPPIKAHELLCTLPLIISYSRWRASLFDLHLTLGLREKETQPLS